jgi:hypothetical protein
MREHLIVVTLIVAASSMISVCAPVHEATVAAPSVEVSVPGTAKWTDTQVDVVKGDLLTITATGLWTEGNTTNGPDGISKLWPDNFFNVNEIGVCNVCAKQLTPHQHALIGYIGNSPPAPGSYTSSRVRPEAAKIFYVGSHFRERAPLSGRLWLNKNTDAYSNYTVDNRGKVIATVTVSEQRASQGAAQLIQKIDSQPWAGYASVGAKDRPINFIRVDASWTVPSIKCSGAIERRQVSYWVGLGGVGVAEEGFSDDLEQIGTISLCLGILPQHWGIWEIIINNKAEPQYINNPLSNSIDSNDRMEASVENIGEGNYRLTLRNVTKNGTWSENKAGSKTSAHTAECIVELPPASGGGLTGYLIDFGKFTFNGCKVDKLFFR